MLKLNLQEEYLIKLLRDLKPFEQVKITADKCGKPNSYLVVREQKVMVEDIIRSTT